MSGQLEQSAEVAERPQGTDERTELLPQLGLFTTTMLVIGGVIGSGIFRKPGIMMDELGSPGLLFSVWLLAGVITLFGVLTNAEISGMITETGGQYVYFERMYGRFIAFLYGWAAFAVIQTGTIAALAYVFAEYATQFLNLPTFGVQAGIWVAHLPFIGDVAPLRNLGVKALAAILIMLVTAINYAGVRFGSWILNVFTLAKLAGMLALVTVVFCLRTSGDVVRLFTVWGGHNDGLKLILAMVAALQGAFWGYEGWVKASFIAGEVREPQKNVPRATLLAMGIVTAVYLLMTVAYCVVLPPDLMAKSKLVAADAIECVIKGGGKWIAVLVMVSTFGAINAVILASARVFFSMARRSTFPSVLGRVHPRFHTPAASLLVQGGWSVLLVFSGTFDTVTDMLVFVGWAFYGAGAYGVFVLRRKEPDMPRSFRVPGYPFIPAIFVGFTAFFLAFTIYNDITAYRAAVASGKHAIINSAFGTFLVIVGTPIYLLCVRKKAAPRASRKSLS